MNRYLKLVHMEINRFKFILAGLMGLTVLCQFGAMIWWNMNELSRREAMILQYGSSLMFSSNSFADMISSTQLLFFIPMMLSIGVLVIYVFLIWYRDWFGRNTFIYRLLMIPNARKHIYFAKVTAILMFVFTLVSFQLVLLHVEDFIFNLIVPIEFRDPSQLSDIIHSSRALPLLMPWNIYVFIAYYGLGILAVLAIFTAILIERSYRRVGILLSILYLGICLIAVTFPVLGLGLDSTYGYLYPNEIYIIELLMCSVVMIMSVWLGCRLLSKKITV